MAGSLAAAVLDAANAATHKMAEAESSNYLKTQFVAVAVGMAFEQANYGVFGSQLALLLELNTGPGVIFRASELYKQAAEREPAFYSGYSFDQWMGWLEHNVRYLRNESGALTITSDGREFLKYLIHRGYPMARPH